MLRKFEDMNLNMERTGSFKRSTAKGELLQLVAKNNLLLSDIILKLGISERFDAAWKDADCNKVRLPACGTACWQAACEASACADGCCERRSGMQSSVAVSMLTWCRSLRSSGRTWRSRSAMRTSKPRCGWSTLKAAAQQGPAGPTCGGCSCDCAVQLNLIQENFRCAPGCCACHAHWSS